MFAAQVVTLVGFRLASTALGLSRAWKQSAADRRRAGRGPGLELGGIRADGTRSLFLSGHADPVEREVS